VSCRKTKHKPWLDGYIPNPATYLRGERWTDEIEVPKSPMATVTAIAKTATSGLSPAGQQTAAAAMQWIHHEEDA
jgi:hypothetical protein